MDRHRSLQTGECSMLGVLAKASGWPCGWLGLEALTGPFSVWHSLADCIPNLGINLLTDQCFWKTEAKIKTRNKWRLHTGNLSKDSNTDTLHTQVRAHRRRVEMLFPSWPSVIIPLKSRNEPVWPVERPKDPCIATPSHRWRSLRLSRHQHRLTHHSGNVFFKAFAMS